MLSVKTTLLYIQLPDTEIIANISLFSKFRPKVSYNENELFLYLKKLISNFLTKRGFSKVFDSKDFLAIFNEFTTLKESVNLLL